MGSILATSDYRITDLNRIRATLHVLWKTQAELEVTFKDGDDDAPCFTVVRDNPLESDFLVLDNFSSLRAHHRAVNGELFHLKGRARGVETVIENLELNALIDHASDSYQLPMPREITYLQRRGCFRGPLSSFADISVVVSFGSPPEQVLTGKLIDLSSEGCRMSFEGLIDVPKELESGKFKLEFTLPQGDELYSIPASFRGSEQFLDFKTVHVGCQFTGIKLGVQDRLDRYVAEIQRNMCKREAFLG